MKAKQQVFRLLWNYNHRVDVSVLSAVALLTSVKFCDPHVCNEKNVLFFRFKEPRNVRVLVLMVGCGQVSETGRVSAILTEDSRVARLRRVNRFILITSVLVTHRFGWFPGHTRVDEADIQSGEINLLNWPKVSPFCPPLLFLQRKEPKYDYAEGEIMPR